MSSTQTERTLCWVDCCGRKATIKVPLSSVWTVDMCKAHALDYEQKKKAASS